jgi:hypothetical protein
MVELLAAGGNEEHAFCIIREKQGAIDARKGVKKSGDVPRGKVI